MLNRAVLSVLSLSFSALICWAQTAPATQPAAPVQQPISWPVTLKWSPKVGDKLTYHVTAQMAYQALPIKFEGNREFKVTQLDADGTFTMESVQLDGKANYNGKDIEVAKRAPSVEVHRASGELVELRGEDATPDGYRSTVMQTLVYPSKPVNLGDAWSCEIKADPKTGVAAMKADYKIIGHPVVGTTQTIAIMGAFRETEGAVKAATDTTFWISVVDGSIVKMESKWSNMPLPGLGAGDAAVTMTRVS